MSVLPPFATVLNAHQQVLWRYSVALAGPVDGPDVYQETVLAALRHYPSLRRTTNLRSWLLTIAHNKVIDAARATARRPLPVPDVPPSAIVDPDPADDELWAAVARLPEKQRTSVVARFVGDLSYAHVSGILGCTQA